ncbi:MAG: ABC transporter ATP-binding protein [Paraclostridium sp.]|uniref:ABC transporter ATP-binding protein n=1 Tax=Paraclostridium sp. TaxID=2023273 RepID=UPI003F2FC5AC
MYFKNYIGKYFKLFIIGVILVTCEAICDLLQPLILAQIIDVGIKNKDINYLIQKGMLMIGITCIGAIFAISRSIISTNVSQRFARDLRGDLFKFINYYSIESIDKISKASLITRITNDVSQIQQFVNGLMRIIIKAPILCIGSLILAMKMNFKLSIVLLIAIIIIFIVIFINLKIGTPFFKRVQLSLDDLNSNLSQYIGNIRIVKLFNRFDYEENKFEKVNEVLATSTNKAMKVSALFRPTITLITNLTIAIVIYMGSMLFLKGEIEVGVVVAYINYIGRILTSLLMISHIFNVFIRARASSDRIKEVFKLKDDIDSNCSQIINLEGNIEFEAVNFAYNDNEYALKDISFNIKKGEHIGIIGSTGSGKTTLINLISKFYKINCGKIKIDNIDLQKLKGENVRAYIGLVPQKSILFNESVAMNIKVGNKNATLEEVKSVCKICECDEFINTLEKGYNQVLGECGSSLSGGQKQRICIARALIKKPKILMLDDSFSAMDINTENKIKINIKESLKDTTYIVISQKISSIVDMDRIMVIDNGAIVGFDKHENLIKNSEIYKEIYKSQMSI